MKRENEIFVDININRAAGYTLGLKTYEEQVKPFYVEGAINIINLPSNLEDVSISFVQGFIAELKEKYGWDVVINQISFFGNSKVVEKFYEFPLY